MYKVVTARDGKRSLLGCKKVAEYPVDHDFRFDILDENNWYNFLINFKTKKNLPLPTHTKSGDPIAYKVDIVGMSQHIKYAVEDKDGVPPPRMYYTLFPGYESAYPVRKLKDTTIYGVLQR